MNKNRIRLTESQLHKVIKESVKQVLSELDWKTYISAAQKRKAQGNMKSANALSDWGDKQFHDEYDINNAEEHTNDATNTVHPTRTRVNYNGGRVAMNQWNGKTNGERYHEKSVGQYNSTYNDNNHDDGFDDNEENDFSRRLSPYDEHRSTRNQRYFPMSSQFKNKLNTMTNDINNFYQGKSQYNNGKWN